MLVTPAQIVKVIAIDRDEIAAVLCRVVCHPEAVPHTVTTPIPALKQKYSSNSFIYIFLPRNKLFFILFHY
jgi:hypothetical protein